MRDASQSPWEAPTDFDSAGRGFMLPHVVPRRQSILKAREAGATKHYTCGGSGSFAVGALRAREMSAHDGWHSVLLRVGRLRECCEARERREAQRLAEMSEEDRFIARQQAAEDQFDAEMEAMSEQECKKMMLQGGGAEDWREYPFRERVYMAHYDRLTPDAERQTQLDLSLIHI